MRAGFDENDRVSIRGTSPSLTQVTVNGHSISTGDWFILDQFSTVGRSVSFTLLPSEIVATTVEVYAKYSRTRVCSKAAWPLRSTSSLAAPSISISLGRSKPRYKGAYNTLSKSTKPQASGLISWQDPAGDFGVLVQGFYEDRSVQRYGQETLGYTQINNTMQTGISHPNLIGVWAPTLNWIDPLPAGAQARRRRRHPSMAAQRPGGIPPRRLLLEAQRHQQQRQLHVLGLQRARQQLTIQLYGRQQHADVGKLPIDRPEGLGGGWHHR